MEALSIGMYVRTINGKIWIITSQKAISGHRKDIIKASYNIIDILEVGDYVNGSEVLGFENECIEEDDKYVPFGIITENCYLDNNKSWIIEKDIKSIVTHEQMEQMAYKVGE